MRKTTRFQTTAHTLEVAELGKDLFKATAATKSGIVVFAEYFDTAATAEQEARDFAAYYAAKHAA